MQKLGFVLASASATATIALAAWANVVWRGDLRPETSRNLRGGRIRSALKSS